MGHLLNQLKPVKTRGDYKNMLVNQKTSNRSGYTLMELLVIIIFVGISYGCTCILLYFNFNIWISAISGAIVALLLFYNIKIYSAAQTLAGIIGIFKYIIYKIFNRTKGK
jgi:hypothetical protein